jgi:uncharacterized protein
VARILWGTTRDNRRMALRTVLHPRRHDLLSARTARGLRVRDLAQRDEPAVARLLAAAPVANAYLCSELRSGLSPGEWWGVEGLEGLRSVVSGGLLLVPYITSSEDARMLASFLGGRTVRMLVGPRDSVVTLHEALGHPAREIRDPQPLLAVGAATLVAGPAAPVRRASRADLDDLVVAAAAMHREEMGVDPLLVDANGWRIRMQRLVERGWSWVWRQQGRIVFKAELSAWTPEAVQIQGVYTALWARREGVATRALTSMCRALLEESALCTLYVNHYNAAALSLYRRVGFQAESTYATVIY